MHAMRIGRIVLFICAGAALAWLASSLIRNGSEDNRSLSERVLRAETDPIKRPVPDSEASEFRSDPQPDIDISTATERDTLSNDITSAPFPSRNLPISDSNGIQLAEPSVPYQVTASQPLDLSPDSKNDSLVTGETTDIAAAQDPAAVAASIFENLIDPTRIRCAFSGGGCRIVDGWHSPSI